FFERPGRRHALHSFPTRRSSDLDEAAASPSRLLAHELTHVVQQDGAPAREAPRAVAPPDDAFEREAERAAAVVPMGHGFRPALRTGPAMHRQAPPAPAPAPAATLSGLTARREAFNNTGAPHADNCATLLPAGLGVDGPGTGLNGMELIFRISGTIPPGTEFEITRTVADGLWQQVGGRGRGSVVCRPGPVTIITTRTNASRR